MSDSRADRTSIARFLVDEFAVSFAAVAFSGGILTELALFFIAGSAQHSADPMLFAAPGTGPHPQHLAEIDDGLLENLHRNLCPPGKARDLQLRGSGSVEDEPAPSRLRPTPTPTPTRM